MIKIVLALLFIVLILLISVWIRRDKRKKYGEIDIMKVMRKKEEE